MKKPIKIGQLTIDKNMIMGYEGYEEGDVKFKDLFSKKPMRKEYFLKVFIRFKSDEHFSFGTGRGGKKRRDEMLSYLDKEFNNYKYEE